MNKKMKQNIEKMLNDKDVSFQEFYDYLQENEIGYWDGVNSEDVIREYCVEMVNKGISVSHILAVIEDEASREELYQIWLGNSMETPTPINTKRELYEALEIGEEK